MVSLTSKVSNIVSTAIIIGGKLSCYTNQVVNPNTFGKIWFVWNVRCIRKILAFYSVHRNDFKRAKEVLQRVADELGAREVAGDSKIAKVSIVGVGMRSHAGVATQMFEALSNEGINIQMISTSEIKVSVVIEEKYLELAVRALHTAFELDAPARQGE